MNDENLNNDDVTPRDATPEDGYLGHGAGTTANANDYVFTPEQEERIMEIVMSKMYDVLSRTATGQH